ALPVPLDTAQPPGWKRAVKLPCSRQLALRTGRRAPGPCNGDAVAAPCVFCAIVRGEVPASFVLREAGVAAFLAARPVSKAPVLVVTPAHIAPLPPLPAAPAAPSRHP